MRSPVDGYVLKVYEKDRRHVMRGTPLVEVGSPDEIEIVASLLSDEVVKVKPGQRAILENWGGETALEAVVEKVEARANEVISALGVKERRVDVVFRITTDREKWKTIGDGFRMEVTVILREVKDSLLVPIGALFTENESVSVFSIDKKTKKISRIPIEIIERNRQHARIKDGISPGTRVVLYPSRLLEPGQRVEWSEE